MTIVFLAGGALLAALGTTGAAAAFVAAAVFASFGPQPVAIATWTAALAAGLIRAGDVRPVAVPVLGAAAVLAAGAAPNGAGVAGLWIVASVAAFLARGAELDGRRWTLQLIAADVPFLAAVVMVIVRDGFESWPAGLGGEGAWLLAASALIRVPLIAGAEGQDPRTGLLVVRTQVLVSVWLAVATAGAPMREGMLVTGALLFAAAAFASRDETVDAVQEAGLFTLTLAASALGWGPPGWEWGVLAGGTLIHHLRLRSGAPVLGRLGALILRGGALGLPWLAVAAAVVEASIHADRWLTAVVVVALVTGLGARVRPLPAAGRRTKRASRLAQAGLGFHVALLAAAGLFAAVLTRPRPPGGVPIPWPPLWGAVAVVVLAVLGWRFPTIIGAPVRPARRDPGPGLPDPVRIRAVAERVAATRVLEAGVVLLLATGVTLWIVGLLRGFL